MASVMMSMWEEVPYATTALVASVVAGVVVGSHQAMRKMVQERRVARGVKEDGVYARAVEEARVMMASEPEMAGFLKVVVEAGSFEELVARSLSSRLAGRGVPEARVLRACRRAFLDDNATEYGWSLRHCIRADAEAVVERDPACDSLVEVVCHLKGYTALTAHRVARHAWFRGERQLALWFQSRVSEVCAVDIHPAAEISAAVMLDHASGVVVGETAKIGDGCTLLHTVTLGATGKDKGDRHPKIGKYVLLGAHTSILGNIRVGDGAKIGAGSVVLRDVPAGATAVGAPARIVGRAIESKPSLEGDHTLTKVAVTKADAGDFACVWRDITRYAKPTAAHLGLQPFVSALAQHGIPQAQAADLFFQLDQDGDGLVSQQDLQLHFAAKAKDSCAKCVCPDRAKSVAKTLAAAIDKATVSPSWGCGAKLYPPKPSPVPLVSTSDDDLGGTSSTTIMARSS